MTTLETLKAARKKIEKPENWTQNAWGRDKNGELANEEKDAVCWCSWGAVTSIGRGRGGYDAEMALSRFMGGRVIAFNDSHTHAEILAAFDEAIASLEVA